jgi:sentrin-specific protease 1
MLCERYPQRKKSHYFNSFFMEKLIVDSNGYNFDNVKRWTKKFDVFALSKIFIPVNISNTHWTMMVIFVVDKVIRYYDSMGYGGDRYLKAAMQWLCDESSLKRNEILDQTEWKLTAHPTTPQQKNGYDCGVFSIMAADFLTDDFIIDDLAYKQKNMKFLREKIGVDIIRGTLRYPNETVTPDYDPDLDF